MTLIKAQREDLAAILALQKECYLQEAVIYNDYNLPPLLQTMESIEADFLQEVFLKIVKKGHIIGSVRGYQTTNICKIGRLIVHPYFQNKGLGKKLMAAIEREFSKVDYYELFTGHKSQKNLKFYYNLGYREFKRQTIHDNLEFVYLKKTAES